MSRRFRWAIALACTALALTAVPASAQWRPIKRQCIAASDTTPGCGPVSPLLGAWNVVVSRDGLAAYAAAYDDHALVVFNRNPGTGTLSFRQCFALSIVGNCTSAPGLARPDEIVPSADGKNIYVTSDADGFPAAVVTFNRNTTTGIVQPSSCFADDTTTGCTAVPAVGGRGALLSADQRNLYVTGTNTLTQFNRNLTTGALTKQTCFGTGPPMSTCTALTPDPGGRQLAISGDGKQLYVPIPTVTGGVRTFRRDTTTGDLTNTSCITQTGGNGCGKVPQIGPFSESAVISPDSRHVYLAHDDGIVTFARGANGSLAFKSCLSDIATPGCSRSANAQLLKFMAISPDGQDLVAVPQGEPGGFTIFARNASTGALIKRPGPDGCLTRDGRGINANGLLVDGACRASSAVGFFGHIHFFGNGSIYAGFRSGSLISLFKRDFYPVCTSRTVTAQRNRTTSIPLTCSDRNGDAITRVVAQAPGAGTLGAINQAAQSVFYNPFSGVSGRDFFLYRGVAAGLAGAPATIAINVPKPPPKKRKHIRGVTLFFDSLAFSDHTVLNTLAVKHVPRGAKVTAGCVVHRHKCPGKARKGFTKKRARGTVNLKKRYVGVSLPVGATITIRVSKRNTFGEAQILKVRSRKAPRITTRCMRPGSGKLRKRC